ncbi:MAG: hypothetical protein U5P41_13455 [Gammaproteobacteria bacterium]|nr:hypothetical protein [Gammaproteobacteria bacterium]
MLADGFNNRIVAGRNRKFGREIRPRGRLPAPFLAPGGRLDGRRQCRISPAEARCSCPSEPLLVSYHTTAQGRLQGLVIMNRGHSL